MQNSPASLRKENISPVVDAFEKSTETWDSVGLHRLENRGQGVPFVVMYSEERSLREDYTDVCTMKVLLHRYTVISMSLPYTFHSRFMGGNI